MSSYGIIPFKPVKVGAIAKMKPADAKVYMVICAHASAKTWDARPGVGGGRRTRCRWSSCRAEPSAYTWPRWSGGLPKRTRRPGGAGRAEKTCGETVFTLTTCGRGVRIPNMATRRLDSEAAESLRAALRKTGLGVREIAERADISAGIVSRFMIGARTLTLPTADRLAAAVGLQWRLVKPRKER